jgi:hypothetical protein
MHVDPSVAAVLALLQTEVAWFLALLLAGAALHKQIAHTRARRAAGDLLGCSWRSAGIAVAAAALVEAVAALGLGYASSRWLGALLAAALWAVYLGLIGRAIVRGRRDLDCGCSFGQAHRPLGRWQVLRTAGLCLLAAAVAALAHVPGIADAASVAAPGLAELTSEALAPLALLALYAALDHCLALAPLRAGASR